MRELAVVRRHFHITVAVLVVLVSGISAGDGVAGCSGFTLTSIPMSGWTREFVAGGDFDNSGKSDIAAADVFNLVWVALRGGDGHFLPAVAYAVPIQGYGPYSLAIGDFNGDGNSDIVTAGGGILYVLTGHWNGTFAPGVTLANGSRSVAVGDFNGDGKLDLAAGQAVAVGDFDGDGKKDLAAIGGTIAIYLGNGNGTFTQAPNSPAASVPANTVSIFAGGGDGSFSSPVSYAVGTSPYSVTIADFNGDSKSDLAVANLGSSTVLSTTVSILLGNGDGTFGTAVNYETGGVHPSSAAAADLDADGKIDLAVANQIGGVGVIPGNGDGTFRTPVTYSVAGQANSVAVADFDGDSRPDIAVATYKDGSMPVLLNTCDAVPDLTVSKTHTDTNFWQTQPVAIYTLTVSNVGLAASTGPVTVTDVIPAGLSANWMGGSGWACDMSALTCTRSDSLAAGSSYPPITVQVSVAEDAPEFVTNRATVSGGGEVNTQNDSATDSTWIRPFLDLAITQTHAGKFFRGQIGATYTVTVTNVGTAATSATAYVTDSLPAGLTATAINGLGWSCSLSALSCTRSDALAKGASYPPILLSVNVASDAPAIVTNTATVNGAGDMSRVNSTATDSTTITGSAADLNVDGRSDVVWLNASTGAHQLWLMDGSAVSGAVALPETDPSWTLAGVGDFNADGSPGIVWRNSGTGQVGIWLMNGTSVISTSVIAVVPTNWKVAGVGDVNNDGKADIFWWNSSSGDVDVWLMNGVDPSGKVVETVSDTNWQPVGVGDFNGDGMADLFWRNMSTGANGIWFMNGAALASAAMTNTVSDLNWHVVGLGDANGDGKTDVVWHHAVTGDADVWLMDGSNPVGAVVGTVANTNWQIEAVGDFDGESNADLIWRDVTTGNVAVWLLNGTSIKGSGNVSTVGDLNWGIVAPR